MHKQQRDQNPDTSTRSACPSQGTPSPASAGSPIPFSPLRPVLLPAGRTGSQADGSLPPSPSGDVPLMLSGPQPGPDRTTSAATNPQTN